MTKSTSGFITFSDSLPEIVLPNETCIIVFAIWDVVEMSDFSHISDAAHPFRSRNARALAIWLQDGGSLVSFSRTHQMSYEETAQLALDFGLEDLETPVDIDSLRRHLATGGSIYEYAHLHKLDHGKVAYICKELKRLEAISPKQSSQSN